jgi:hypothetical protein
MTEARTTFREVLAQPVYRLVLLIRALTIATDTLRIIALSVLIFASTGSAALAAAAFGIGFAPQVIGGGRARRAARPGPAPDPDHDRLRGRVRRRRGAGAAPAPGLGRAWPSSAASAA